MRRTGVALLLVLGVLFGSSACAGGAEQTSASPPSDQLRVGLTEWTIVTGGATATEGDVRILVTNSGATVHDLVVDGAGGTWATPILQPGEEYELQIQTTEGETLHLTCTVTGHESQGMHTTVEVVAASPG